MMVMYDNIQDQGLKNATLSSYDDSPWFAMVLTLLLYHAYVYKKLFHSFLLFFDVDWLHERSNISG